MKDYKNLNSYQKKRYKILKNFARQFIIKIFKTLEFEIIDIGSNFIKVIVDDTEFLFTFIIRINEYIELEWFNYGNNVCINGKNTFLGTFIIFENKLIENFDYSHYKKVSDVKKKLNLEESLEKFSNLNGFEKAYTVMSDIKEKEKNQRIEYLKDLIDKKESERKQKKLIKKALKKNKQE